MDQICTIISLVQDLDENMDGNLAWLTQKTEDSKM